jgi:hypothetical protein
MLTTDPEKNEFVLRLPVNWKMARDTVGRPYFYHTRTKETRWDPPPTDDLNNEVVEKDVALVSLAVMRKKFNIYVKRIRLFPTPNT